MKIKKLSIISFTYKGAGLADEIAKAMALDYQVNAYTKCSDERAFKLAMPVDDLQEWAKNNVAEQANLLFIGACGIAVRTIAPFIKDKLSDPAVLVADEAGAYIIPILSGHFGGANELATMIAEKLNMQPVLTTATDVNNTFAVDVFAAKNDLVIANKSGIAKVSSKLLRDGEITMSIEGSYLGTLPKEVKLINYPPKEQVDVVISARKKENALLTLIPKCTVIGMGCKKGISEEALSQFLEESLDKALLYKESIIAISSAKRKEGEPGLIALANRLSVPFETYEESQLAALPGEFSSSDFVKSQLGVDNVCERAAILAAGDGGSLIVKKTAKDGMTIAIAKKKWSVNFDEA